MKIASAIPTASLREYYKEYYFLQLTAGQQRKHIPTIDDCSYDFVCYKEANATLEFGRSPTHLAVDKNLFTVHDLKPPYSINFEGSLTFFTIKLQPWYNGFYFSSLPGPGIQDASGIIPGGRQFFEQLMSLSEPKAMFTLANKELSVELPGQTSASDLVKRICLHIIETKGVLTVNELSDHFGKSRQYLNKIFKQHVLYSLKKYITTVRILDLVKYRSKRSDIPLTAIAYEYGYFDQAHFIHDFKNVCGVNPSYFFDNLPEFILRH